MESRTLSDTVFNFFVWRVVGLAPANINLQVTFRWDPVPALGITHSKVILHTHIVSEPLFNNWNILYVGRLSSGVVVASICQVVASCHKLQYLSLVAAGCWVQICPVCGNCNQCWTDHQGVMILLLSLLLTAVNSDPEPLLYTGVLSGPGYCPNGGVCVPQVYCSVHYAEHVYSSSSSPCWLAINTPGICCYPTLPSLPKVGEETESCLYSCHIVREDC